MAKSQDLIPQPENNLAPVGKESVLRLRGRWAVISSAALAALTQVSLLFSWGKRILEWVDLADFTSTRFIEMLRWLFSPAGAQTLFVLFLTVFFIAIYRTLFPKGKAEQPANNLVEGEQPPPEADVEELQGQYKRLHEKADEQREDISKYVKLKDAYFCYQYLNAPESLRSVFALDILNKSVFNITIEDAVEGYIKFEGSPLKEKPRIINLPINAAPSNEASITIEQALTRAEADFIESQNLLFAEFDLENLVITITGSEPSEKVKSQPLEITRQQGVIRVNKIRKDVDKLRAELKAEQDAHNIHIEELSAQIKELEEEKASLEERSETLNTQQQSEKDKLEKQVEGLNQEVRKLQSNADILQMSISSRDDELKQLEWMRGIAEAQAKEIEEYVKVESVHICDINLRDGIKIPYVEFWLNLINTSVYDITIHTIDGHIKFQLNKLLDGKDISYPPDGLPHSRRVHINIKQRLTPSEVDQLTPYEGRKDEAAHLFNLNDLVVTISGGAQFPQVKQTRLMLPQYISVSEEAQRAEATALRTQVVALQSKLESLSAEWPNLVFLYPQINYVHVDSEKVIREGGDGDNTLVAIIAKFKNEAAPPRKVSPAKSVIAYISYYDINGQPYEYASDKGAWVNEEYNHVEFDVGDTRRLILAVERPIGNMILGYQNNNDSPDRRRGLSVFRLDKEQFIVQVELVVRGQSEAGRKFKFKLTLKPLFSLELIEPQPPE